MTEAGVVVDFRGEPIFWHLPEGRTSGGIPDTRKLWDVLWENRAGLWGFAHTHPGSGHPTPSHTDITTFAAIEAALGTRNVSWWIASRDQLVEYLWDDREGQNKYKGITINEEPAWLEELRRLSYEGR
jgi:hypothetical protein